MEDIAGQALLVDAYQWRGGLHVTHDEGDSFVGTAIGVDGGPPAESVNAELAPAGGKIGARYFLNFTLLHANIIAAWVGAEA